MHVSDDDSNKFCKFDDNLVSFEKMWKFHNFSIAGIVGIFS